MHKETQRLQLQKAVRSMSDQERHSDSDSVCDQLMGIASVSLADTIFAYLPTQDEVDLRPLLNTWIEESRTVCVPLVSWEDQTMSAGLLHSLDDSALTDTRYGLKEPVQKCMVPPESIDVIIVPGVGFDDAGCRLGHGGGYYDRFLAKARPPIVIGVAFDSQVVESIPREQHDQLMTAVVTPTQILLNKLAASK